MFSYLLRFGLSMDVPGDRGSDQTGLPYGVRIALLALSAFCLWLIAHVPPFSAFDALSTRAKADFLTTFLAARYPGEHRQDIVIVEVDKEWLLDQHLGTSREGAIWPPRYKAQARAFEMAATVFTPRAIFIDIWWEHIRPEEVEDFGAIEDFLCAMGRDSCRQSKDGPRCERRDRLGDGDTPVVLAHYSTNGADEGFERLNALVEECAHLSWAWIERFDDYARAAWYRLAGANGMETPAVALYRQHCVGMGTPASCAAALARIKRLQEENAALSVVWGPPRIGKWYDDDGAPCLDDPSAHGRSPLAVPCPYTPRLNTRALEWLYKRPTDQRLSNFISDVDGTPRGPIVMIGGALDLGLDRMRTGNTDQDAVTGVHLHAMALDNLLQWSGKAPATSLGLGRLPIYWDSLADPLDWLRLFLAIVVAAWLMFIDDKVTHRAEGISRFSLAFAAIALVNFLALICAWIGIAGLMWGVSNLGLEQWIGISFYSGVVGLISKSFVQRLHMARQVS